MFVKALAAGAPDPVEVDVQATVIPVANNIGICRYPSVPPLAGTAKLKVGVVVPRVTLPDNKSNTWI